MNSLNLSGFNRSVVLYGQRSTPQPWETKADWKDKVTQAVIKYPLAPRQARAILEMAGVLASNGLNPVSIFRKHFDRVVESYEPENG